MRPVELIIALLSLYAYVLFVPILLSWIPHDRRHPAVQALRLITDPVLLPCRELMYAVLRAFRVDYRALPIDFSPILAFMLIRALIQALASFR